MKIEVCGLSDIGLKRENNEDSILLWNLGTRAESAYGEEVRINLSESSCLMAVMDGMGGQAGGEVASQTATSILKERALADFDGLATDDPRIIVDWLAQCAEDAHRRISKMAEKDKALKGMGTTWTVAVLSEGMAHVTHVGDSRLYHFREGILRQLTVDHTLVQRLVSKGQISRSEVKEHPQRHVLVQSIGGGEKLEVERLVAPLAGGDVLLWCSDGLHDLVEHGVLSGILGNRGGPRRQCERLVEEAKKGGGPDNISTIVAHIT